MLPRLGVVEGERAQDLAEQSWCSCCQIGGALQMVGGLGTVGEGAMCQTAGEMRGCGHLRIRRRFEHGVCGLEGATRFFPGSFQGGSRLLERPVGHCGTDAASSSGEGAHCPPTCAATQPAATATANDVPVKSAQPSNRRSLTPAGRSREPESIL